MKWWDDLWLNEGFANTLMYFALDSIYEDWRVVGDTDNLQTFHNINTRTIAFYFWFIIKPLKAVISSNILVPT